jgi:hypothetical protein
MIVAPRHWLLTFGLLVTLTWPLAVRGQVVDHGSNDSFTGSVGIGTQTPHAPLDVNGSIFIAPTSGTHAPFACDSTTIGVIGFNCQGQMLACNGSSWIIADSTGTAVTRSTTGLPCVHVIVH